MDVTHGRKVQKPSSILSLFNLKEKSKFWSERVLRGAFEDLERPGSGKAALTNFTRAASVADYLKLAPVDAIYLPIPINFIFIGFEGKGNQALKLGQEELERWFSQIDHVLEHTRVPQVGEALTPFYRQRADGEQRHHLPLVSYIHYNYSVHAIEMGEKVTAVFERALRVLSRKNDLKDERSDSEVQWQVDIDSISYLFTSLLYHLQLENVYNIFILNPKRDPNRSHYGYRRGLSDAEIQHFKEDGEARMAVSKSKPGKTLNPLDMEKRRRPLYEHHPMLKFAWTGAETVDTAYWVDAYLDALDTVEKSLEGKTPSEIIIMKAQEILHRTGSDISSALQRELRLEENAGLHSECLVDTWVGSDRWAFMDLSAGPFSWGPAVGGVGIRTELTLPSVDRIFGNASSDSGGASEEDAQQDLQDIVQDRFSVFQEEEPHAVDTLLAEIDIYELFSQKHCEGRRVRVTLCEELQERMEDLKDELQALQQEDYDEAQRKKAQEALKRIERWNLFSDAHETQHIHNYSVARDWFLAQLGATLWSSMKHVVTPATADGAFHFYEKIHVQIYIITQEKFKHIDLLPVDISLFKEALAGVVVPHQKLQFAVRMLALSEDSALSMAFSVARRAAAVPILFVNGTYRITTRLYLDSLILQHQLQHISESGSVPGQSSHPRSSLEVPIFWFIQEGEPLFIDKHYLAKALPDMVIVVQSSTSSWASHLQCNGDSISWDLSRPLQAAVAASAEHLAGLLPSHFTYSQAHGNGDQDWRWSAGCHPFSSISFGWHVSLFQSDTIARSYIITTLDESIEVMNEAIKLLLKEPTYKESFEAFRRQEHILLNNYNSIISLWKRIAQCMEDFRYGEAMKLLHFLEDSSTRLMRATNDTITELHPIHCTRRRKLEVGYEISTGFGLVVLLIIVLLLLRPRQTKPKIN